MNPFHIPDMKEEIEWYGISEWSKDGISINTVRLAGRCDELLNVAMFISSDGLDVPIFRIDGEVWMSLTPMELQAAWTPIQLARGTVATAGIGMGYFALKVAEKDEVEIVDVYEQDERVIKMFNTLFKKRKGFEKINIIHGDVYDELMAKEYDLVWMDVYQTQLPDKVFDDAKYFMQLNDIETYRFFAEEKILVPLLEELREASYPSSYPVVYNGPDIAFLELWQAEVRELDNGHTFKPSELRSELDHDDLKEMVQKYVYGAA